MTKILFGVCGVGAGHYIRSKVIIDHLSKKHEILIIAGLSAFTYLKKQYKNVYWVDGIEFGIKDDKIVSLNTLTKNLKKISIKNYLNLKRLKKKVEEFKPDIVISDWELFTTLYARDKKLKTISVDNEHFILYGQIKFDKKYRLDYYKTYLVSKLFKYGESIVIGLPGQKLRNEREATIVNPIIRRELTHLKPKNEGHILVYKSITNNQKLIDLFKKTKARFIVYDCESEITEGNVQFKKFEEKQFLKDLANCRGVITTGGITLISEAIYLKKPLLVIPIKKHFEQILNAEYVKEHNLGMMIEDLDLKTLNVFLLNLERFATKKYEPGNKILFEIIEHKIKETIKK